MSRQEQIQLIAKLFKMNEKEVEQFCGYIEACNALYFSIPEKGGDSLIVGEDGSVLYADSSVGYTNHLKYFQEGKRTSINWEEK